MTLEDGTLFLDNSSHALRLRSLLDLIDKKGLHVPVLFFVELHKPLVTLASALVVVGEPFLRVFGLGELAKDLQWLFESRDRVEEFLVLVEKRMRNPEPS